MENNLRVMLIVTGVKSPQIFGKKKVKHKYPETIIQRMINNVKNRHGILKCCLCKKEVLPRQTCSRGYKYSISF